MFDKAVDHAESEAAALADFFGGEERIKGALLDFGGHACTVVLHGDTDVMPGREWCRRGRVLGAVAIGGGDKEVSAVRHGVTCVECEVEQGGFKLCAVDVGVP